MYIKSFDKRYNLIEFNIYGTGAIDDGTYVLELLIDCSIDEFEENGLDEVIVLYADRTYMLIDYQVNEFYGEDGYVRVICVK